MIFVVRRDLKMGVGKIVAQCCHGCESVLLAMKEDSYMRNVLRTWRRDGGKKIVLRVDSYSEFKRIVEQIQSEDLLHDVVVDAGHTQVEPDTETVLCIAPGQGGERYTSGLKLL